VLYFAQRCGAIRGWSTVRPRTIEGKVEFVSALLRSEGRGHKRLEHRAAEDYRGEGGDGVSKYSDQERGNYQRTPSATFR